MLTGLQAAACAIMTVALPLALSGCSPSTAQAPAPSPSGTAGIATATGSTPTSEWSAVSCASLASPVYQAVDPRSGRTLLTMSSTEAAAAAQYGYSDNRGVAMRVSRYSDIPGLVAIHRLSRSNAFAWATQDHVPQLVAEGFTDSGVTFYAGTTPQACTQPVIELIKDGVRTYASEPRYVTSLEAAGWSENSSVFYTAPAQPEQVTPTSVPELAVKDPDPHRTTFTFAAIPDTQLEVHSADDTRLEQRSQWLVDQQAELDLRFAVQVGDLVDWDSPNHEQYVNARRGLEPLERNSLPYFLNVGNHDGQATYERGYARDPRFTPALVRMTEVFNRYFSADRLGAPVGEFEPGKLDNTYTTIAAGGSKWLLLNLELWPRTAVITWAASLVATHPQYNVIVATHAFLDAQGNIDQQMRYGSTTSAYLFDHLIALFPNIKVVLCGHVGAGETKILRGQHGNEILTFLQAYHSETTNPVRLIQVDTSADSVTTWVTAPATGEQLAPPVTYRSVGLVK